MTKIVIYPLGRGSKWRNDELRHSLRSIHTYLEKPDKIYILTSHPPRWLRENETLKVVDAPGYKDTVMKAVELAKGGEYLWMNDDIFLMQPMTFEDFRIPRRYENPMEPFNGRTSDNGWWTGLWKFRDMLATMGVDPIYSFSTHTPYLFDAEKMEMTIAIFGVIGKAALETAYYNLWAEETQVMTDKLTFFKDRAMPYDVRDMKILNVNDRGFSSDRIRGYIRGMFPNPSPWEKLWQSAARGKRRK